VNAPTSERPTLRARVPWGTFVADEVRTLYEEYAATLDAADYGAWLDLFVDDATYIVTARENVERGLPLATIRCDSKGMLADRIDALVTTQFHARRLGRHFVTAIRPVASNEMALETTANFLLVETIDGEDSRVQSVGSYADVIVPTAAGLRFVAKCAIYDAALVPTSVVVPL
jgi:3-phenylpropionate/cinnamic acid dioxygenase small subunit